MLLFFYRSILTVVLVLTMLILGLSVTRGVVAFLGYHNLIGLSPFATQLLVTLAIAATTDYAIFLIGRYQEARTVGEDRESAYYTMFRGTAHVVLASGMTIAGATFCLTFTRLPWFQTLGIPLAIRDGGRGNGRPDARARPSSPSRAVSDCWSPSAPCGSGTGDGWPQLWSAGRDGCCS